MTVFKVTSRPVRLNKISTHWAAGHKGYFPLVPPDELPTFNVVLVFSLIRCETPRLLKCAPDCRKRGPPDSGRGTARRFQCSCLWRMTSPAEADIPTHRPGDNTEAWGELSVTLSSFLWPALQPSQLRPSPRCCRGGRLALRVHTSPFCLLHTRKLSGTQLKSLFALLSKFVLLSASESDGWFKDTYRGDGGRSPPDWSFNLSN